MAKDVIARRLQVNGIVQGVGFRPFVYNLANFYQLTGEVSNTSNGVTIRIEGSPESIEAFAGDLTSKHPPLAQIVELNQFDESPSGYSDFTIIKSRADAAMSTLISPDVTVCDDCLNELFDPQDRRFEYPFINCTNCGPRYTIIDDIPYDRPKTSMKHFMMCPQCQAEYDDPTNRRFHAQPNACPVCGPQVTLCDRRGVPIADGNPIQTAAERLKGGQILAIKGLGGYHLAVDAQNEAAVQTLRRRKQREEKPLALMSPDLATIRTYARLGNAEEGLLGAIQRPIVLLPKKQPNRIGASVSPRNRYFGVMLPYTPLHYLLLSRGFEALVMTSGNLSEEPIAIDNADAFERLAAIADVFLIHDRDIYLRCDDSIVRHEAGQTRLIRRSRGYVPVPVFLKRQQPAVLAVGAELKNTLCLTRRNQAFISQHVGDLENLATHRFFERTIGHMQRILEVEPEIIAHDMHPDYLSTRWASEQNRQPRIAIQHHHAHIVSTLAENKTDGPVIGISCDGTGFGADGTIWGGEVLLCEPHQFTRAAHIQTVPMPGGAAAIKQPWRMAATYLNAAFGPKLWDLDLPLLSEIAASQIKTILQMADRKVNSPLTSSLGRLFDGVAAILGIRQTVAFEGQAAMELEMMAAADTGHYAYALAGDDPIRILPQPIIQAVVNDLSARTDRSIISARFHNTMIVLLTEICERLKRRHALNRVALSGGVFQNAYLLSGLIQSLGRNGFDVITQRQVPCNDGGISLGQAVAAAAMMQKGIVSG